MLTQQDLEEVKKIVKEEINGAVSHLPTKDDFAKRMDEVMGELEAIRQEQTIGGKQLSDHSDQLEAHDLRFGKIDKHLGISTAS